MHEIALEIRSDRFTLEGALRIPDGAGPFATAVVCHPHPQYGGNMYNNVVMAATEGLLSRGIAALRFNFRGAAESAPDDVRAALRHVATLDDVDAGRIGLAGYSFGAGAAATVADAAIPALALIALPTRSGRAGATLGEYRGPLLLMAGDQDDICDSGALETLAAGLSADIETKIVMGADHFWLGYEGELASVVGDFFARALGEPPAEE